MNKVHDMGGREEKRRIPFISCVDKSEELPPTHWTSRTLAITLAMGFLRVWNLDSSRFFRESLPKSEASIEGAILCPIILKKKITFSINLNKFLIFYFLMFA